MLLALHSRVLQQVPYILYIDSIYHMKLPIQNWPKWYVTIYSISCVSTLALCNFLCEVIVNPCWVVQKTRITFVSFTLLTLCRHIQDLYNSEIGASRGEHHHEHRLFPLSHLPSSKTISTSTFFSNSENLLTNLLSLEIIVRSWGYYSIFKRLPSGFHPHLHRGLCLSLYSSIMYSGLLLSHIPQLTCGSSFIWRKVFGLFLIRRLYK